MGDGAEETARELSKTLSGEFPIINRVKEVSLVVAQDGSASLEHQGQTTWRVESKDQRWRISINHEFIALETTLYRGRRHLISRFQKILGLYQKIVDPPLFTRMGVRYTNRLIGDDLDRIAKLIRPQLLGIVSTDLPDGVALSHAISSAIFSGPSDRLLINWGLLPSKGKFDPTFPAADEASWVLDIDAFIEQTAEFDTGRLTAMADGLCDRSHRCFRWAVTPEFLAAHRK
jgi:uncharacterized protein (TIGR04255 family)